MCILYSCVNLAFVSLFVFPCYRQTSKTPHLIQIFLNHFSFLSDFKDVLNFLKEVETIIESHYLEDRVNAYLFVLPSAPFLFVWIHIQSPQTTHIPLIPMEAGFSSIWLIVIVHYNCSFTNTAIKRT